MALSTEYATRVEDDYRSSARPSTRIGSSAEIVATGACFGTQYAPNVRLRSRAVISARLINVCC